MFFSANVTMNEILINNRLILAQFLKQAVGVKEEHLQDINKNIYIKWLWI